jgi:DNA-binding PadR family transcriptional regulator
MDLDLSPGEWAVLGAVAEGPTHGFAVAQLLAPDGELGRVWTLPRPVVYQVIQKLLQLGLVQPRGTETGRRGPVRTIIGATPGGRAAIRRWLAEPVDHVRDVRSLLLLKLALIDRRGGDPAALIEAQKVRVRTQLDSLTRSRRSMAGFDRVILEWRIASSRATLDFLRVVGN